MRLLIQRVKRASVTIENTVYGEMGTGLLLFLGIEASDGDEDIQWLSRKAVNMRIFDDEAGVMNKSLLETGGELLVISQFTLHASTRKGNRPSYARAARPETAIPLYEKFVASLEALVPGKVQTGQFGAYMKVDLLNDGPVTIWMDSRDRQ
jgi:D-tyrosyl-tRNA(Tyr) deacylase